MVTITDLIKNGVKYPVRRAYIKRRDSNGDYETNWFRIDNLDGINRVINWGSVEFKIDADKVSINSFDISTLNMSLTNQDGSYNSNSDSRSIWNGYLDHKDTKIKIDVAMEDATISVVDPDEVGLITAFEGIILNIDSKGDNTASLRAVDYGKKLNDYSFRDLSQTGTKSVSTVLTAIFADTKVGNFFATSTLTPVEDVDLDLDTNEIFSESYWKVIKFLAEKSNSTIIVKNDDFFFGDRDVAGSTPDFTFAGLGNAQADRTITIYGKPVYDQGGIDKLYTKIIDKSSSLTAESADTLLKNEGKTYTLDLTDVNTGAEKQDILDAYLARWGVRRPTLSFNSPFMMFLLYPLDLISVDSPGAKTEMNAGYYDSNNWDDGSVYDGDGGSAVIDKNDLFVIESIKYDLQEWVTNIFAREKP